MLTYLILDIETVADPKVIELLDPVKPDARLKDPVKIEIDIAEKTAAREASLALDPDYNRIIALGYYVVGQLGDPICMVVQSDDDEREQLKVFGALYKTLDYRNEVRLVTYNGIAFDLPTVMRRASLLEAPFPELDIDKYRSLHARFDVMWQLTFKGVLKMKSLKFYARRYGLPLDDTCHGSEVAQLVKDGHWDAVQAHCMSDIGLTHALANRLGLLKL